MTTIDLTTPVTESLGLLDGLPRRVTLTLPELQVVAQLAGGAPLPFAVAATGPVSPLDARLGASPEVGDEAAYAAARDALHDPVDSLTRRGLIGGSAGGGSAGGGSGGAGRIDPGLAGAVGLLATPRLALEVDVAVAGLRAKAWHRQAGGAVASLSTADGLVFELAWFPTSSWAEELARIARLPEDLALGPSQVPSPLTMPFVLADAALEAIRAGRADLVPVLAAQHASVVRLGGAEREPTPGEVERAVTALADETRGRLRVLVADAGAGGRAVAVVSWLLVRDGWRTVRTGPGDLLELIGVNAASLATELGPSLAEVTR